MAPKPKGGKQRAKGSTTSTPSVKPEPVKDVKPEPVKDAKPEPVQDANSASLSDTEDDPAFAKPFSIGLTFFGPQKTIGTKAQQIGPQQLLEVLRTDDVEDLLSSIDKDTRTILGGELEDWRIDLKADGSRAGIFRKATQLKFAARTECPDTDGITVSTRSQWEQFKEALVNAKTGSIEIHRVRGAVPDAAARSEQKLKAKDSVKRKGPVSLPHVTAEVAQADKDILAANICHDPSCRHRGAGNQSCWVPSWAPELHMPLDNDNDARYKWACALSSRTDPDVTTKMPPMIPPFVRPDLMQTQPADTKKKISISLLSDSDEDIQITSVVESPVRKKREKNEASHAPDSKPKVKAEPVPSASSRPPLAELTNQDVPSLKRKRSVAYGPNMSLAMFCSQFDIPDDVREKLAVYRATTPYAVAHLDEGRLREAGLSKGLHARRMVKPLSSAR